MFSFVKYRLKTGLNYNVVVIIRVSKSILEQLKTLSAVWETLFDPSVGTIPRGREWQPPPVFLPGDPHRQRRLVGYSPWGRKELDTAEANEHARTHPCLSRQILHH